MDKWGYQMLDSIFLAAEMAAIGMGLEKSTFTSRMIQGPHLLAPTASDLNKYKIGNKRETKNTREIYIYSNIIMKIIKK